MDNNIIDKRIEKFTLYESENHISIDTTGYRLCDLVKTERNKDTAAFIVKACNEYPKLKLAAKLLEELTPGGSEYFDDPEYCFKTVKGLIASIPSQILPFKRENDRLLKANKELLEALKEMCEVQGNGMGLEMNAYNKAKEAIKKHSPIK